MDVDFAAEHRVGKPIGLAAIAGNRVAANFVRSREVETQARSLAGCCACTFPRETEAPRQGLSRSVVMLCWEADGPASLGRGQGPTVR